MHIDLQLLPLPISAELLSGRRVVVMDILRATSVMVQALSRGAREIIPVKTVEEAFQVVKRFPSGTTLLGGERGSRKIEGFDFGNSPREYQEENVRGKRLILTTTNGTRAFHVVSSGEEVLVGSFFNISAVAERCLRMDRDVLIYPSGDEGHFSLEDTVCGGMLVDRIIQKGGKSFTLTDASRSAHILFQRFEANLVESLYLSQHGRDLIDQGFDDDLTYCAQLDTTTLVPVFKEGVVKVHPL